MQVRTFLLVHLYTSQCLKATIPQVLSNGQNIFPGIQHRSHMIFGWNKKKLIIFHTITSYRTGKMESPRIMKCPFTALDSYDPK